MPTYSYFCPNCNTDFELFFYISEYTDSPVCGVCKKKETYRMYCKDVATQIASVKKSDSELKTIGDLANRNRDRLSNDETEPEKPLPKGMTRMKKGTKTIWPN